MKTNFIEKLRFNENGLIPAIAQDWLDGSILMMAWMNRQALLKTIETNKVHYWSRSRQDLWLKGETSGNLQILKGIRYDCDADALLLSIDQKGDGACHTGARSCFYRNQDETHIPLEPPSEILRELFSVIEERISSPEEGSYTNKLLQAGDNLILKKIGEESTEFVMACKDDNPTEIANEAADLLFHVQVAIAKHNVKWIEVLKVLASRRNGPRRS